MVLHCVPALCLEGKQSKVLHSHPWVKAMGYMDGSYAFQASYLNFPLTSPIIVSHFMEEDTEAQGG